jgi:hypothetical protein
MLYGHSDEPERIGHVVLKTARPAKLCQGHQQMGDQDEQFSHASEL